jgi:hypothetical protein
MEAKWPFLLLILFFVGLTGYLISQLERNNVTRHWDKRRCDFTVMLAARFFKPPEDPRTPGAFSSDNFDFCVKTYSESFLSLLMAPISWLMSKQVSLTGSAMGAMNAVRNIAQRITNAFSSYLSSYTKKLSASMFELRRIMIYLRQAVQRMMAMAVSTIYMGMTLFRGMISSFQTIIRVILIICAIMIAVIILLWFILLPIIPFILTTLTAVVALVGALSVVMSTSLASQAESQKGGFCFSETTPIRVQRGTESMTVPIREVRMGDHLEDGSVVTMIMEVTGDTVDWYEVEGIQVAGDHRILGGNGWCLVREDPRAKPLSCPPVGSPHVFCLNTTSHVIPLRGKQGTCYYFRDWEEFEEGDEEGHRRWREGVMRVLHPNESIREEDVTEEQPLPWMAPTIEVATLSGWKVLSDVCMGDWIQGPTGPQRVLGKVSGYTSPTPHPAQTDASHQSPSWIVGGYVWDASVHRWKPWKAEILPPSGAIGWNLITDTGEWTARTSTGVYRFRDATEVGHHALPALYSIVADRLCTSGSPFPSP